MAIGYSYSCGCSTGCVVEHFVTCDRYPDCEAGQYMPERSRIFYKQFKKQLTINVIKSEIAQVEQMLADTPESEVITRGSMTTRLQKLKADLDAATNE